MPNETGLTVCERCQESCIRFGEKLYDTEFSTVLVAREDGFWEGIECHVEHECSPESIQAESERR